MQPANSVAELLARFERPDSTYGPIPIWWWSGARLDNTRLRWQMEQLTSQGVNQAVVMCLAPRGPIFGSVADDPPFLSEPWWEIFLQACADAAVLGFSFWLYDQIGFSGANFQGQVVSAQPSWAGHELRRRQATSDGESGVTLTCPAEARTVGAYFVPEAAEGSQPRRVALDGDTARWSGEAGRLVLVYAERRGFDYFCAEAGERLVDTVLGEFERRAGKWFGSVIVGLFQDELPAMPTWGADFAETFAAANGYPLADVIALLWEDGGDLGRRVRRDYHAHRGALAQRGFFDPLAHWTRRTGVIAGFDQQSPARDGDPSGGVALYGDYLRTHNQFTAPGSDHWGDPKIHSSLAHAQRHPRTWLEGFHSSGWGGTLEETYDWLSPFLRRGVTLYDPHAVYYATVSGWWEWAPPSTCWRQPYWPAYGVFSAAVTRLCSVLSIGELVADTVLLYPLAAAQAGQTLAGALPEAVRAGEVFHELNGVTAWFSEAPGVLDRAGIEYEAFDDATVTSGVVSAGALRLAGGTFGSVVLPAVPIIDAALAHRLAELSGAGGHVICVGVVPQVLAGADDDPAIAERFRAEVAAGRIVVVPAAADVPGHLPAGSVTADAPVLVRRHGEALVLLLTSHDDQTGTQAPIMADHHDINWVESSFRWDRYWTALSTNGYEFLPVGDRRVTVHVQGVSNLRAQQWDPRTGRRTELDVAESAGGVRLVVPYDSGPMSVIVLAPELPAANGIALTPRPGDTALDVPGPWQLTAESTLNNLWGDLGDRRETGTLPLRVWRVEHAIGATDDQAPPASAWADGLATFGPYVHTLDPQDGDRRAGKIAATDERWKPATYSLSRGIHKDALHFEYLGPKGMVPEEFLAWPTVRPGQWVAFRTSLPLPAGDEQRWLVLGANAERCVFVDGVETGSTGDGYWSTLPLPAGIGDVDLEVWLLGDAELSPAPQAGPTLGIRASFAVVTDLAQYRRPEWLRPAEQRDDRAPVTISRSFALDELPVDAMVQVCSEGACGVFINGREIGRQGAFEPYAALRQMRVHPYDLASFLRLGENTLELTIDNDVRAVAALVDSRPAGAGGLGLSTDANWTMTCEGTRLDVELRREQWTDPRWVCLYARPHPLPRAGWLDPAASSGGTVLDVVPNAHGRGERIEWLRFPAPVGAVVARVDAHAPFTAFVGGRPVSQQDGVLTFAQPLAPGRFVHLRFAVRDGHTAGGLLRGPVTVELAGATAGLGSWEELGLRSLGGQVTYEAEVMLGASVPGERVVVDLGEVRGAADVRVNSGEWHPCIWSPYRADVTDDVVSGRNVITVVVRGTLAGYLDDVSPTPAIAAGQTRTGLFGPVRLRRSADAVRNTG